MSETDSPVIEEEVVVTSGEGDGTQTEVESNPDLGLDILNTMYGKYSDESREEYLDFDKIDYIHPEPGADWRDLVKKAKNPIKSAIFFWSQNPHDEYAAKEFLAELSEGFPDAYAEVQTFTWWVHANEAAASGSETIIAYRAIIDGEEDFSKPRPFESLTLNKAFAESLCDTGERVLVTYEVPWQNILVTPKTTKAFVSYNELEQEIILNKNGNEGVNIEEIDKSGQELFKIEQDAAVTFDQIISNLPNSYEEFINKPDYITFMNSLPDSVRTTYEDKVNKLYNLV